MATAVFLGPGGRDAGAAMRAELAALSTITAGDLLYVGQVFRSRIRQRTFQGIDAGGASFAAYSAKGPYYLYPNRDSAGGDKHARSTAAANRRVKTGGAGRRTPFGIRYDSYAAAKQAHGVSGVNLYGMEQHTHMLDTMLVKAGGAQIDSAMDGFDFGSPLEAFEHNTASAVLTLGFYGPEAARAKGNNEGSGNLPARRFFALSGEDLALGDKAIADRLRIRAARVRRNG